MASPTPFAAPISNSFTIEPNVAKTSLIPPANDFSAPYAYFAPSAINWNGWKIVPNTPLTLSIPPATRSFTPPKISDALSLILPRIPRRFRIVRLDPSISSGSSVSSSSPYCLARIVLIYAVFQPTPFTCPLISL